MKFEQFLENFGVSDVYFERIQSLKDIVERREVILIGRELKEFVDRRFPKYRKLLQSADVSKGIFAETILHFYESIFDKEKLSIMVNAVIKLHEKRNVDFVDFLEVYSLFVNKLLNLLFKKLGRNEHEIFHAVSKILFAIGEYILLLEREKLLLIEKDPITGFLPRYRINTRFEDYKGKGFGFIVDIRNFANINTVLGYEAGDSTLIFISEVLKRYLLENGKGNIFRLQGDQFFIFLKAGTEYEAKDRFNAVMSFIEKNPLFFPIYGVKHKINVPLICVGAKITNQCEFSCFLWSLEKALSEYKKIKKTGVYIIDEKVLNRCYFQRENLRMVIEAIEEQRVTFALQKIIDISNGRLFGYEALARLINKNGNIIRASLFFDNLNLYSLDEEIDRIVIEKAFSFKSKSGMKEKLSVNVSNTLLEGNVEFLIKTAEKYGINPEEIILEFTERQNLSIISGLEEKVSMLKSVGFKIFIDDFGVDYANFHLIDELSIDGVKIDGKFIKAMVKNSIDREFVSFVLSIARNIGITVVAEFIENEEILKTLNKIAGNIKVLGQGYLFGKPEVKV